MWYSAVLLPFSRQGINTHELLNFNSIWRPRLIFQFSGLNTTKEKSDQELLILLYWSCYCKKKKVLRLFLHLPTGGHGILFFFSGLILCASFVSITHLFLLFCQFLFSQCPVFSFLKRFYDVVWNLRKRINFL